MQIRPARPGDAAGIAAVHVRTWQVPSRDDDADAATTGEVTNIYVDPGAWGAGAGRELMAAAMDAAAARGSTTATLWVLSGNPRARRFYAAAGWAPDGASKDEDIAGTTVTEVRYRRAL